MGVEVLHPGNDLTSKSWTKPLFYTFVGWFFVVFLQANKTSCHSSIQKGHGLTINVLKIVFLVFDLKKFLRLISLGYIKKNIGI